MLATGTKGFVRGGGWTGFEVVGAARVQTEPGLEWHATKDLICYFSFTNRPIVDTICLYRLFCF